MKKACLLILLTLFTFRISGQNILWEQTYGFPSSGQYFSGCVELGNDLFVLSGFNDLEYMWGQNSAYNKPFWKVIEGESGNTLFTRYWNFWYYGFPTPFSADKRRNRILSTVFYRGHDGSDSLFSFRSTSLNLDTTHWETYHDVSLFNTLSRWTRTMPAIDGGFIDCRERGVQGYISQSRVAKFDSMGNLEWQRQYGPPGHRCFTTWMDVTRDSCYIISGMQHPLLPGSTDSAWCYLQKIDRFGNEVWRKTFLVDSSQPIRKASLVRIVVEETPDFGYLITGSFATSTKGYSLNAKFDSTLTLPGRKWYMPSDSGIAYGKGYSDGSCMLAGSYTSLQIPFTIRRTGPNGETIWKKVFTNPCRGANAVVFNSESTAILAGSLMTSVCFNSPDYNDFWWAKIDGVGIPYNPLAVKEDQIPRAPKGEMELWPNPASSSITIRLASSAAPYAVDMVEVGTGRHVFCLFESLGQNSGRVDVEKIPAGVYHLRFTFQNGTTLNRKLVVIH